MHCREFKEKMATLNEKERNHINKLTLIEVVKYLEERG